LSLYAVRYVGRVLGPRVFDLTPQPNSSELVKVMSRNLYAVARGFNIRTGDDSPQRVVEFRRSPSLMRCSACRFDFRREPTDAHCEFPFFAQLFSKTLNRLI
jgi:hypothetical protein